jgi:FtsP/CotA-like multicopper oxidase with cupredoxin domain
VTPAPISRRRALTLGGLGAVGLIAGTTGWIAAATADIGTGGFKPGITGTELLQPPVLDSRNGRLSVELVAAAGVRLAGRDTSALGFNGGSPGPTLRVRPGDELAVRVTNQLGQPTNLHTHGLRVSPEGNSDNPFLRIDPGESFDYLYRIPADHPAGTHWYHPHHHGVAADQLFAGLVGGLIVDRGPDVPVTADRLLLITDIALDDAGAVVPATAADRARGREGELLLVNGQYRPTITAAPGATERWRVVNACTSRFLALRLEGRQLDQIALDGSFLPRPAGRDTLVLAPGNRADVLVRPQDTGRFALSTAPYDRGSMMGRGSVGTGSTRLATLVTSGPPHAAAALPAALAAETPTTAPVTRTRTTDFRMGMGAGMGNGGAGGGMAASIDGRAFDPGRDDQTVAFGSTEEWTVTNSSPLAHPFHIHVWPFTVTATSDGRATTGTPQDVVIIPPRGWVRLRIPFTTLAGRTVYHCHILDHEDAGMMATVVVA